MADYTHQQECLRDCVNVCQLCGELENLSVCGACKGVWYCSKSHQRQDWKKHKPVCKSKEKYTLCAGDNRPINNENDKEAQCGANADSGNELNGSGIAISEDKVSPSLSKSKPKPTSKTFETKENSNRDGMENSKTCTCSEVKFQGNQQKGGQSSAKNKKHQSSEEKHLHRDGKASEGRQQRYYLKETTQTLSLPPSLSELSNCPSSKPNMGAEDMKSFPTSHSREQYLLILQSRFNEVSKYVVKCLMQYGICVVDKFLGEAMAQDIFEEAIRLQASGAMNQGQLVNGPSSSSKNKHIRGDVITWMDGTEAHCENIHHLVSCMDTVMLEGAKSLQHCTINERTKAMVACYPGGGRGYIRHVDNPSRDGRCVTCIYYLNKNWNVKREGGLLRIYPEGSDEVANIEPVCDRLLFFWSDRRNPHEVEGALKARYAITVWYYDADERAQALRRLKVHTSKKASKSSKSVSPVPTS